MLAKSLAMSQSTPLSLTVHFNLETTSSNGPMFRGIWNVILPHLDRCWSLTVTHWDAAGLQDLLPLPGHLANLAYLQLEMYGGSHLLVPMFERDSISPLQELVIHHHQAKRLNWEIEWEPEWRPEVPVSKLARVTISLTGERVECALIFLEQCPALTHLTLNIKSDLVPHYDRPITLQPLQILSITDAIDFEVSHYINAPNLHTLTVTGGGWPYNEFMLGSASMAPHTIYPLLQKLHISIGSLMFMPNLTGLRSFVRAHPSIEVLSIEGWPIMTDVVSSLLNDDEDAEAGQTFTLTGHTRWLPNLHSLSSTGGFARPELERDPEHHLSPSTLVHAVLLRRPNLHVSVGPKWQGTRHQTISEGWRHDSIY